MNRSMPLFAVLAMALFVGLNGCGSDKKEQQAQAEAAAAKAAAAKAAAARRAAAADPTAHMARAPALGKSQAVVDLKYFIAKPPLVGEPIEIELAFVPSVEGDSMSAAIASVGQLKLEGELTPNTGKFTAGQLWKIPLVAHAATPDAFYFTVSVDFYLAGVRTTRNFAIPLLVSAPAAEPQPEQPAAQATEPPAAAATAK